MEGQVPASILDEYIEWVCVEEQIRHRFRLIPSKDQYPLQTLTDT